MAQDTCLAGAVDGKTVTSAVEEQQKEYGKFRMDSFGETVRRQQVGKYFLKIY